MIQMIQMIRMIRMIRRIQKIARHGRVLGSGHGSRLVHNPGSVRASSPSSTPTPAAEAGRNATSIPVPRLRLFGEPVLVAATAKKGARGFEPVHTAVAQLSFLYGGVEVLAADPRARIRSERGGSGVEVIRDSAAESEARRMLESLGPVEIDQLESHATELDSGADYVVDAAGDEDAVCAFFTHAIPRLRTAGWKIDVDPDYAWQVVPAETWYGNLRPAEDDADWFQLEMGVDVGGERVDLLPALLELLAEARSAAALDEKLARARRDVAVRVDERRLISVPAERLRALVRVFKELYDLEGASPNGARVPADMSSWLDEIDAAMDDSVSWSGGGSEGGPRRIGARAVTRVPPPPELQAKLRPYQQAGLDWLQHLRAAGVGGILADDMGLGKTLQTIAHICTEKAAGRLSHPCLVVAPTSLVGNWHRELKKFAPHLSVLVLHGGHRRRAWGHLPRVDVAITTYGTLLRDNARIESQRFSLLVLDEAQAIKNPRGRAHAAVKALDADHHVCLSGTPIENDLEELWALFDIAAPGLLGSLDRFRSGFRVPIERMGNQERLATLRRRVGPYVLRRMKEDVAPELPDKTEIVRAVELPDAQRDLYEGIRVAAHAEVRKVVRTKGLAASTIDILGALMKLRQSCCDPRLVRIGAAQEVERSAKLETLLAMLEEMVARGRRILVFSQFTSMLQIIAAELRARRIRHVVLTGESRARQELVDEFQAGLAPVFLISLKAGGTGLNLTRADTVIHYDPWWNPAAQSQATDRAYRIGQDKPVFVYNLVVAGSVEERILALQKRKKELADGVLSGAAAPLTAADVDDLFAPLTERD
jgi:superfamily II DNA or RNA helicase